MLKKLVAALAFAALSLTACGAEDPNFFLRHARRGERRFQGGRGPCFMPLYLSTHTVYLRE